MDVLAHALYGATFFSRTGFAGGRLGMRAAQVSFSRDWTVWAAAGFGLLPDMTSIGVTFLYLLARGEPISFHALPSFVYALYHGTHSLVTVGVLVAFLWAFARPLLVPALAWPLHIVMDSFTHSDGYWQTLMFYPFSGWHYHGFNWWQYPGLMVLYWGILPVLWIGISGWRWRVAKRQA